MVCLCSVDVLSESVQSIVESLPVLVGQEGLSSERGKEGPESPGEVQSVQRLRIRTLTALSRDPLPRPDRKEQA